MNRIKYTGLVVKIDSSGSFDNSYIVAENDTLMLPLQKKS